MLYPSRCVRWWFKLQSGIRLKTATISPLDSPCFPYLKLWYLSTASHLSLFLKKEPWTSSIKITSHNNRHSPASTPQHAIKSNDNNAILLPCPSTSDDAQRRSSSGNNNYDPSRLYKMLETACLDLPTPAEVSFAIWCSNFWCCIAVIDLYVWILMGISLCFLQIWN